MVSRMSRFGIGYSTYLHLPVDHSLVIYNLYHHQNWNRLVHLAIGYNLLSYNLLGYSLLGYSFSHHQIWNRLVHLPICGDLLR